MQAGTLEDIAMEVLETAADADAHLLRQMFDHDVLSGEIFRQVYGIEYAKHYEAYQKGKGLPDQVRDWCTAYLAQKQPRTPDAIAHAPPA